MKATTLLTVQHRKIERLFHALSHAESARHLALGALVEALLEHMVMEEAVFYWISRQPLAPEVTAHYQSNSCARPTLTELMALEPSDSEFSASVLRVLDRFVLRNQFEDENLIPRMELLFSDAQLDKVGRKIEALYAAFLQESEVDAA